MKDVPINVLYAEGVSALGDTVTDAVDGMFGRRQAFSSGKALIGKDLQLGIMQGLTVEESRAYALLSKVCERLPDFPKEKARLYLASTVGAIDLLEKAPAGEKPDCTGLLLQKAREVTDA